ncbi:hypothetical protein H9P43_002743 [Blastocladiella emersonii ATCC 22665]|nr:hypothetical protein H9P43_002743 [Blastocladiella emersonii ATCC 22665]
MPPPPNRPAPNRYFHHQKVYVTNVQPAHASLTSRPAFRLVACCAALVVLLKLLAVDQTTSTLPTPPTDSDSTTADRVRVYPPPSRSSHPATNNLTFAAPAGPDVRWDKYAVGIKTGQEIAGARVPVLAETYLRGLRNVLFIGDAHVPDLAGTGRAMVDACTGVYEAAVAVVGTEEELNAIADKAAESTSAAGRTSAVTGSKSPLVVAAGMAGKAPAAGKPQKVGANPASLPTGDGSLPAAALSKFIQETTKAAEAKAKEKVDKQAAAVAAEDAEGDAESATTDTSASAAATADSTSATGSHSPSAPAKDRPMRAPRFSPRGVVPPAAPAIPAPLPPTIPAPLPAAVPVTALEPDGDATTESWERDANKLIPGVRALYTAFPTADWYVLADDDSYLLLENLHRVLVHLDPKQPHYLGMPTGFQGCDARVKGVAKGPMFARTGAGIVLSRGAVEAMLPVADACIVKYQGCWLGDVRLALCLRDAGVALTIDSPATPLFHAKAPHWTAFHYPANPCSRPVSFHALDAAAVRAVHAVETEVRDKMVAHRTALARVSRTDYPHLFSSGSGKLVALDSAYYAPVHMSDVWQAFMESAAHPVPDTLKDSGRAEGDNTPLAVDAGVKSLADCRARCTTDAECRVWELDVKARTCRRFKSVPPPESRSLVFSGMIKHRYVCKMRQL